MFLSYLSAKSVACSKLKVVGVSLPFFFPFDVISLTNSDEFHSVKKTRRPLDISHFSSRRICVDLPDPSIPSTTTSLPLESRFLLLDLITLTFLLTTTSTKL